MKNLPTITENCDCTVRIAARRIGFNKYVAVSFDEISNIIVNLINLPNQKTAVSHSIDSDGRLIIPISGENLVCNMYGIEILGFYNNGNWRHQIAPAFDIVRVSAQDNYALQESDELTIDYEITIGETTVSTRLLDGKIEEHNIDKEAHQDLRQEIADLAEDILAIVERTGANEEDIASINQSLERMQQAIEDAGKVDDVQVDGQSVLDNEKIAHIDSSGFGHVDDVKVNGESVVENKVANITIPENLVVFGDVVGTVDD